MTPVDDPTPRSSAPPTARIVGIAVIALLVLAIILLALGVFDFEQQGWFG